MPITRTICPGCQRQVRLRQDGRVARHWHQALEGAAKTPCPVGEAGRESRS